MSDFAFLLLTIVPVFLLALWAGYMLATRKAKGGPDTAARGDHAEPRELTGGEQHKHRRQL